MKRLSGLLTAAALCMAAFAACNRAPKEFTTVITGVVIDRPETEALVISRIYDDPRVKSEEIPVVDGRFRYELRTDTREMYELVPKDDYVRGSWMPAYFFTEPGEVHFMLHPIERAYEEDRVSGGKLNTEYMRLQDSVRMWWSTFDSGVEKLKEQGYEPFYMTMTYNPETEQSERKAVYPDTLTVEGRRLHNEYLALTERTIPGRELAWYRQNPSLVSYGMLFMSIRNGMQWGENKAEPYLDVYRSVGYSDKYPDHPFTRELEKMLFVKETIKVGGRYVDFTLPDLEGNAVTVSEYIKGKVALIDLWMTWCGPCRRKAISAIPVYEEFGDKGFTVVGVNGDNDADGIRAAVEQDGYPWLTLVDLGGAEGIWSKYGIEGSGGSTYLVDRDGTILAVDPGADEIRKLLAEKL